MVGVWSDAERTLLRLVCSDIGPCIANPAVGIQWHREGHLSGGGPTYGYKWGDTTLSGEWHESVPNAWRKDGRPWKWDRGRQLGAARISYKRLQAWCESLPADIREQAVQHWRVYPVDTRDLPKLDALTLAVIEADDPAPALFPIH